MCKVMEDLRNESLKEGIAQGIKQGIKQGMKQGISQGITQANTQTALRMLQTEKYPLAEIAEISGLSPDDVKKLQTELHA